MCHLQDMASVDPAFYDSKVAYILEGRYQDTDTSNPYGPMALYGPMIYVNFVRILWR